MQLLWFLFILPVIPTARAMYGLLRANAYSDIRRFNHSDRVGYGAGAVLLGFFWPLTVLWYLTTIRPHKYEKELLVERRERAREIERMEIELEQYRSLEG